MNCVIFADQMPTQAQADAPDTSGLGVELAVVSLSISLSPSLGSRTKKGSLRAIPPRSLP